MQNPAVVADAAFVCQVVLTRILVQLLQPISHSLDVSVACSLGVDFRETVGRDGHVSLRRFDWQMRKVAALQIVPKGFEPWQRFSILRAIGGALTRDNIIQAGNGELFTDGE